MHSHSTVASSDELIRVLQSLVETGSADYDVLREAAATSFVNSSNSQITTVEDSVRPDGFEEDVAWLKKRPFLQLRRLIGTKSKIAKALTELFVCSRIRNYTLAYLSVQEGEDFEGSSHYDTPLPQLIATILMLLGKKSLCVARIRSLGIRWDWDPLVPLRRIYTRYLKASHAKRPLSRTEHIGNCVDLFAFRSRLSIATIVFRIWQVYAKCRYGDPLTAVLGSSNFRLALTFGLAFLFPEAMRSLSRERWKDIEHEIIGYLGSRISTLLSVIPSDSINSHGLIKLLKVAVGTIAGRIGASTPEERSQPEFIFATIRLAYCWGLTYPLVDNVLDSSEIDNDSKQLFLKSLDHMFSTMEMPSKVILAQLHPATIEVLERLQETMRELDPNQLRRVQVFLRLLAAAHGSDAIRRLSDVPELESVELLELEKAVYADTMLKSAMVRLTTMEICGIQVDNTILQKSFSRSLFNQLGDDLWDIYEDFEDNRVTPFTLFLVRPVSLHPFGIYFNNAAIVAHGQSKKRQRASRLGVMESIKDAYEELSKRPTDQLQVEQHITKLLSVTAIDLKNCDFARALPHVDFDAVLFAMEDACFDMLR